MEHRFPAGTATPWHVHDDEDETFLVSRRAITVQRGETTMRAQAGDVVFLPRGPARLPVDSDEAVLTDVVAPAVARSARGRPAPRR